MLVPVYLGPQPSYYSAPAAESPREAQREQDHPEREGRSRGTRRGLRKGARRDDESFSSRA